MFGTWSIGYVSDVTFKGERRPANFLFALGICISAAILLLLETTNIVIYSVLFFLVGFFVNGPYCLIGLTILEVTHKRSNGAAVGFCGLLSSIGAGFAGYPISKLIEAYGWEGYTYSLIACGVLIVVILAQKQKKKEE